MSCIAIGCDPSRPGVCFLIKKKKRVIKVRDNPFGPYIPSWNWYDRLCGMFVTHFDFWITILRLLHIPS